jgi:hypothetical protein
MNDVSPASMALLVVPSLTSQSNHGLKCIGGCWENVTLQPWFAVLLNQRSVNLVNITSNTVPARIN